MFDNRHAIPLHFALQVADNSVSLMDATKPGAQLTLRDLEGVISHVVHSHDNAPLLLLQTVEMLRRIVKLDGYRFPASKQAKNSLVRRVINEMVAVTRRLCATPRMPRRAEMVEMVDEDVELELAMEAEADEKSDLRADEWFVVRLTEFLLLTAERKHFEAMVDEGLLGAAVASLLCPREDENLTSVASVCSSLVMNLPLKGEKR